MTSEDSTNNIALSEKIRKLSAEGGSLHDYEAINAILGGVKKNELEKIIRSCDIVGLFMSMDLHHGDVMQVAITLATTIFSVIPLLEFTRSHEPEVLSALKSDNSALVCFLLGKVSSDYAQFEDDVSCIPESIFDVVTGLIVSDNIAISQAAIQFFKCVGNLKRGCEKIYQPTNFLRLTSRCTKQEHFIRVCEMSVDIFREHPENYSLIEGSGILKKIVEGLEDEDPLTNLNYLEIAKSLALTKTGYEFLESNGTLEFLVARLRNSTADPLYTLLLPGYLKFFGVLARQRPAFWFNDSSFSGEFLRILACCVNDVANPSVSLSAFDALGYAAGSVEVRKRMNNHLAAGGILSSVFPKMGRLLQSSPTEVCVRIVECVGELLHNPIKLNQNDSVPLPTDELSSASYLSFAWAAALGGHALTSNPLDQDVQAKRSAVQKVIRRLVSLAKQPYIDIRYSALRTIHAVSTQLWGVNGLLEEPGFMEHLLNRKTEAGLSKTGELLGVKFDIVSSILATSDTTTSAQDVRPEEFQVIIRPQQAAALRTYVRQGVWGAPTAQTTIAFEPT